MVFGSFFFLPDNSFTDDDVQSVQLMEFKQNIKFQMLCHFALQSSLFLFFVYLFLKFTFSPSLNLSNGFEHSDKFCYHEKENRILFVLPGNGGGFKIETDNLGLQHRGKMWVFWKQVPGINSIYWLNNLPASHHKNVFFCKFYWSCVNNI